MGMCNVAIPKPIGTSHNFDLQLHICFAKMLVSDFKTNPNV